MAALTLTVDVPSIGRQCATGATAVLISWLLANSDEVNCAGFATLTFHLSNGQISPRIEKHLPKVPMCR